MSIKVLLADDHGIIRQGLKSLLEKQPDIEVVAEAADGMEVVDLVAGTSPDVIIMDITMPNLNGIDATKKIVSQFPNVKIIALSIHSNRRFVKDMLKAGACGYIPKDGMFQELILAVRTVVDGGIYLSPQITALVVDDYISRISDGGVSLLSLLSDREVQVLQMISEGKSTKQIALQLHVSPRTIESNRRQIMDKLNLHSVAELTKFALKEGLTSLEL